ncbi:prepilin-type N-terminal cleavage/methylation domain-containing protein [Candidatus Atribacteria bacterium 1244-E10-H5-B2]|nr:MAG: prepilin-type N-terminal cleavage/methylation domain-containing protein [Candidatus Atribacteria bacterium 1244-E10-H5-B2]
MKKLSIIKGFTLIELMVVIAIIGVLALLGLRLYTGQQDKAKNAIVKANVGHIQTLIQAKLADEKVSTVWTYVTDDIGTPNIYDDAGIRNPFTGEEQTANETAGIGGNTGDVYVEKEGTFPNEYFSVNGNDADKFDVYDISLTASK